MTAKEMRFLAAVLVSLCLGAGMPSAIEGQDPESELETFGALIVGTWIADDAKHVNSWGVGRKLIRSESYFLVEEEWTLVSEGIWYWNAEEGALRSTQIAINMPVERFEYRSEVMGSVVEHQLTAFGPQPGTFVEIWSFDEDGYEWWLESPDDRGTKIMGGAFQRAR